MHQVDSNRIYMKVADQVYTTRLQKGGALLDDMRLLVRRWTSAGLDAQRQEVIGGNILGKITRARSADTIRRAFLPRFVKGNPPNAWEIVRPLEDRNLSLEVLKPLYFWITARNDPLMYQFVTDELFSRRSGVDPTIRITETKTWIARALANQGQEWTDTVRTKVARGLLAALRDFGLLDGKTVKTIAPAYLPIEAFTYIAFVLHSLGAGGEMLVEHDDWKLFLLPTMAVERLFLTAHQRRLLSFEAAGRVYRIEFSATTFEGMADVIARSGL